MKNDTGETKKFKVGDCVRTTDNVDCYGNELFPIGTIGTIAEICGMEELPYRVVRTGDGDEYWYSHDMLEPYVTIKDSGGRTQFFDDNGNEIGQRDIQTDKGRCDLLPLDVVALLIENEDERDVISNIADFMNYGDKTNLIKAIRKFCLIRGWTIPECILEVSIHYRDGASKYNERNWEKGLPLHSYIDSGVRHLLKKINSQEDERHDRAFIWNMFGALWTLEHKPELNDLPFNKEHEV